MRNLEERLTKMEKTINIYRMIFGAMITIGFTFVLMSADKKQFVPDRIQAKSFEVVDDYGNVLVSLKPENGNGLVNTYSKAGYRLVSLFPSDGGGGGINTFDTDGQVNFKVTRTMDGGGYMALFNSDRKEVFEVGTTTANSGYFRVNDRDGEKLAWLTYTTDGGGYFSLFNRKNEESMKFSTPDAGARVGLYNGLNNRVIYLGTQENKDGNITVYNASGSRTGSVPN
ncbi:MAG: hypothetical protein JWQ27_597 [Ferruginibacter sp.]|nr:hypothetical protein [Ferruginibacter sp.]